MYTELENSIEKLTREIQDLTRRTEERLQKAESECIVRTSLRRSVLPSGPRCKAA